MSIDVFHPYIDDKFLIFFFLMKVKGVNYTFKISSVCFKHNINCKSIFLNTFNKLNGIFFKILAVFDPKLTVILFSRFFFFENFEILEIFFKKIYNFFFSVIPKHQ